MKPQQLEVKIIQRGFVFEHKLSKDLNTKRASERTTSNVFSRLAAKKSLSSGMRRKPEKRDMTLDFFDKQYKNAIKGGISEYYD